MPTFELEHLTINPSQQAGLLLGTGDLLPEKTFHASLTIHYQHRPLVYLQDGKLLGAVVRNRFTVHLAGAYSINKWIEVAVQLPIIIYQAGDSVPDITAPSASGMGTPWIDGRIGFLSEQREQPLDLALQVGLGFPIGSESALARDGTVAFRAQVQAGRSISFLRIGAQIGALVRHGTILSSNSTLISDEVGSSMHMGASLTTTNKGLRGELTLYGRVPFTKSGSSMELMLGARYPIGPFELYAMAGPGFGRTPGTPAYRVLLGIGGSLPDRRCIEGTEYDPKDCPKLDIDHDGVINEADQCLREPGVAAYNGCPIPDSDGDTVLDDADKCPQQKGLVELQGCPDRDQDGIADGDDGCPNEAGPKENNGCPFLDEDKDGLLDKDDGCPKVAGPKENKGCPWPDTDADGLIDPEDGCPSVVGPKENKGCPWPDTDKDTVNDNVDNCPTVAGPPENQGCPKNKKQLVIITREKLVIKEKVYFETGKAAIKPQSFGLLTQIADVLNAHPEIARINVEGHTDTTGSAETNRKLSQARADSVRDFLVKKKVHAGRVTAKGFGPDRLADVNTTPAGRENNRRVEFVVVSPEAQKCEVQEVTP